MIKRERSVWIPLALCLTLLGAIAARLDYAELKQAFSRVVWVWVVVAAVVNLLNTWVEATRWRIIVRPLSPTMSVRTAFEAMLVGVVGNSLLPFKLGDGVRAYALSRKKDLPLAGVVSTVILDRVADVTSFMVLVLLATLAAQLPAQVVHRYPRILPAAVAGIVVLIALSILYNRIRARMDTRVRTGVRAWIQEQERHFVAGLAALHDTGIIVPVSVLAVVSWGARLIVDWSMLRAFNLALPAIAPAVVLIAVNISIFAVATPANLGTFELSAMAALMLFGVSDEQALGYAVGLHVVELVPSLLLGLAIIWANNTDLLPASTCGAPFARRKPLS